VSRGAVRGASSDRESVRARVLAALGPISAVVVTAVIIAAVFAFLLLPIVALVVYQPLGQLLHELNSQVVIDAVEVSLKTNLIAVGLTLVIGTPFAYAIGRRRFRGRSLLITLVELPLVLPPAVAGVGLLVAYGRLGLLGHTFSVLGIGNLGFTQTAVVMAITIVASPFYLRGAIGAFEAIDPTLVDVAGTLGAGPLRRMLRVALPLARSGLGASAALSFARGLGEFGATILFAGSFEGTTQTLPTAIYQLFATSLDQAVAVGVLLVAVSASILLTAKLLGSWTSSISTSRFRGGRSISAPRSA
jgi:molybdate transport system permease protein